MRLFSVSPAELPEERRPNPSISSMKTTQGACFLACAKSFLTRRTPRPRNMSLKSLPESESNSRSRQPLFVLAQIREPGDSPELPNGCRCAARTFGSELPRLAAGPAA